MECYELLSQDLIHGSDVSRVAPEGVMHGCESDISIQTSQNMKITFDGIQEKCTSYGQNQENERSLVGRLYFTSVCLLAGHQDSLKQRETG